jgi:2-polyprenyl-3-methyl-5-hydroxy-6-metoxy-1,4-benzoquinol methylase
VSVLDLGDQPLSNDMGLTADEVLPAYPLHLRICPRCGLGQVGEFVRPDRIFGDNYPYLSSTSTSWVEHARRYAADRVDDLGLADGQLVVEVASNDGYLLSEFQRLGVRVLGIEPARNVAQIAMEAGIPTITEFFGRETAAGVVAEHGHPRLVTANNVMAHVPDLHDFVAGFAELADDDTVITVENPSLMSMLSEAQFDTIYHEHYSYLTAHAVRTVVREHGLDLVRIDQLPTHGGSNRYWIRRTGDPDASVARTLEEESRAGLFDVELWKSFAARSHAAIDGLRDWLLERSAAGGSVAGYGAAAKGNTFLNAVGDAARTLRYVVDGSAEKQGKFLPGTRVPVLAPVALAEEPVDEVVILPWNLAVELGALVRQLAPEARSWVAIPRMAQLP